MVVTWQNPNKSVIETSYMLAETGDFILQENGDKIILEQSGETTIWATPQKS